MAVVAVADADADAVAVADADAVADVDADAVAASPDLQIGQAFAPHSFCAVVNFLHLPFQDVFSFRQRYSVLQIAMF